MVLSEQDKKILLDRLKAGREKKKAEREALAKKLPVATTATAETPVSAPTTAPATAPEAPPEEQIPPELPRIDPSKPRKAAKRVEASSDSDSDIDERKEKKNVSKSKNKKKNIPYMKIKIYAEPKNPEALNALIGAVQEEQQAPPAELPVSPEKRRVTNAIPKQKMAQSIVRPNTMRSIAMDIFG
jgi:hypothetical protein